MFLFPYLGCKYVRYCSVTCQKAAWTGSSSGLKSGHREECAYLQRVKPKIPTDTVRLLARIILRLRCGGGLEVAEIPNGTKYVIKIFIQVICNSKDLYKLRFTLCLRLNAKYNFVLGDVSKI